MPLDPPAAIAAPPPAWNLGPREAEVLILLIAGQRNREIGQNLGISENTVKFHVVEDLPQARSRVPWRATALVADHRSPFTLPAAAIRTD